MKQLSGYVLVKETGVGVQNLVITVYDARDVAHATLEQRRSVPLTEQLGRRLGSVLTDSEGRFLLSSEDLEFDGNEARPNLSVAVFAPEDVQSLKSPLPLPPDERLLFLSSVPRKDAGAEEAFVIRILQAQLDRFSMSTVASAAQGASVGARLADAIESAWDVPAYLKERFRQRIGNQVKTVAEGSTHGGFVANST